MPRLILNVPPAIELGDDGLLPAKFFIHVVLAQALGAEIQVGRELPGSSFLLQDLLDLDRLFLELDGHAGENVANGPG